MEPDAGGSCHPPADRRSDFIFTLAVSVTALVARASKAPAPDPAKVSVVVSSGLVRTAEQVHSCQAADLIVVICVAEPIERLHPHGGVETFLGAPQDPAGAWLWLVAAVAVAVDLLSLVATSSNAASPSRTRRNMSATTTAPLTASAVDQ